MRIRCVEHLNIHLCERFGLLPGKSEIIPELCPPTMIGDITINCFRISKAFRCNPMELAKLVVKYLRGHSDVTKVDCVKAFVNISLKNTALFRDTVEKFYLNLENAKLPLEARRHYLIEFSAPNTNKPQHLGHVRNNALGMALCSLLRRVGHKVTAVNLVNDRGIHICKSMIAYQRFGNQLEGEIASQKGDHFVGHYYVKFEQEFQRQLKELKEENPQFKDQSSNELFLKTEIGSAAQKMLQKWEGSEPETRELWKRLNDLVLSGFDQTYKRMGITFDHTYFESNTYRFGKELIENHGVPIFNKNEDGSVEIDLSDNNLGKKIVLRSDGTSVYVTQDIGTTVRKHKDFASDYLVWVVGDEQIHHFKVLFAILKKMEYPWAENLKHIAYGMVNLPSGKMKSREGTVVDADDLFDEMFTLARHSTLDRSGDRIPDDLDHRAHVISMGALKYMLLKFNPRSSIAFDPSASMKFEGDTGPYIQYAYARIASILRKHEGKERDRAVDWSLLNEPEERKLSLRCALYGDTLLKAAEEFDSSGLANYLLILTKEFNRFYKKHSVLNPSNPDLKRVRIGLCNVVQGILKDGLNVLNIETLEAM